MLGKSEYLQEKKQVREGIKAAFRAHKEGHLAAWEFELIASEALSWEIDRSIEEKMDRAEKKMSAK